MKKVIFCGFGALGSNCLARLINSEYQVVYILTHKELEMHSVDTLAKQYNIPFSYSDTRRQAFDLRSILKGFGAQFLVSVNYRYILPKEIFTIPDYAINIHGSLLPKYRGRTPHVWSIINGEQSSGVTCHLVEEKVDTGDIIEQYEVTINNDDTGYNLLEKFNTLYPDILISSLIKLEQGEPLIKQDETKATYFGKRTPEMGFIDFNKDAKDVINFIRAQAEPYPGAYSYLTNGNKVIINQANVDSSTKLPILQVGAIHNIDQNYYVKCRDAILKLVKYRIIT